MIKAFIFDLDGVVTNTVWHHFMAWKKMFKEEGIKFSKKDYQKIDGIPRNEGIKKIVGKVSGKKIKEMGQRKQKYYREFLEKKPPRVLPGFKSFVKKLKKKKIKIAVASSSKNTNFILEKLKIKNLFDVIITGYDFKNPKPHPEIFLKTAKKLKIPPYECVVVEDSQAGIEAAKRAGMKVIGFSPDKSKRDLLQGADKVISSFGEIEDI
jgi:beta-phosphoglucomutase